MKKIVIALGGNALGNNPKEQAEAVKVTAKSIVDLIASGNEVIVSHGNGPQVGMISLAFDEGMKVNDKIPYMPLALVGAMSQGYIGLQLQQAIKNEINKRGLKDNVVTLITQTEVSADDPSFQKPSKPIGAFYSEADAKKLAASEGWTVAEDAGRGWRRMVPSPLPINIIEKDIIKELVAKNIVIAGGGGGIPTVIKDGVLTEIDAVIDKDFTSAKLAELVEADILMIVTVANGIWKNFGKEDAYKMDEPTVKELEQLLADNHFAAGSMEPKVKAAISFVKSGKNRSSCVTSLELTGEALEGKAGSWIKE